MNVQTSGSPRPKLFPPKALGARAAAPADALAALSGRDLRRIVSAVLG